MLNEPLRGWREVVVGDQRTAIDWAHVVKHLVDVHYADADQIVLVMDNLNTHTPGSLYEAVRANRSSAAGGQAGDSLHAQTWQLAEYGRIGTERSESPVPRPPHSRSRHAGFRDSRLDTRPKRGAHHHRLALHDRRRPHQAQAPLPGDSVMTLH